jgi:ribosome biogenesis GTPase / thiamine phosphate phosphatase
MSRAPQASAHEPQAQPGRVIASHGRRVLVQAADARRVPCAIRGRDLQIVCGDEVRWREDIGGDHGIVLERLTRRSVLERANSSGGTEVVVANLTQLIVVVAHEPTPDFFIVDRFLAAAELSGIRAALARNKIDAPGNANALLDAELANYARIGYSTVACSSTTGAGLDALRERLRDRVSVLVGQSGVGKSSLANQLIPGLQAETAELSAATEEGRHVTSASMLHRLPGGGDLIDSPGVRDFAPAIERIVVPALAFREFAEPARLCRFSDCRHLREPDCAVRARVADGSISARRYESFKRLSRLREQLAPPPGARRPR